MYVELDRLTRFQRPVAIHLNRGVVSKNILAAVNWTDKAKPFGIIEPFDCSGLHAVTFLARCVYESDDGLSCGLILIKIRAVDVRRMKNDGPRRQAGQRSKQQENY